MDDKRKNKISKFMSLILRHEPATIGLQLDEHGWADIAELLLKSARHRVVFSREDLLEVVSTNDKQRFALNEDATKIRANQGHSVDVELDLEATVPPDILYHGTVVKFLDSIKATGLKKMQRWHVHLSRDEETAIKVGNRRGDAIILRINCREMYKDGFLFFLSANGVWLTDNVPAKYISF